MSAANRAENIINAMSQPIVVCDPIHPQCHIVDANPSARELFGDSLDHTQTVAFWSVLGLAPTSDNQCPLKAMAQRHKTPAKINGREHEIVSTPLLADTKTEIAHELRDVEATFRDEKTGLYNDRYLKVAGTQTLARTYRDQVTLSAVFVDIDRFKNINDTFGHPVGDKVLKAVGRILQESFREEDIVARWGGEEFVILASEIQKIDLEKRIQEIRKKVALLEIFKEAANIKPVTVSVGYVNKVPDALDSLEEHYIKWSDSAMYQAKQEGRNKVFEYLTDVAPENYPFREVVFF